jgi:hypothetical protein
MRVNAERLARMKKDSDALQGSVCGQFGSGDCKTRPSAAKQFAGKVKRVSSRAQRGLPAAGRDLLFAQVLEKKQIPPAKGACGMTN